MTSKKQLVALAASICILLLGLAGVSLAYFTASVTSAHNVIAMGNIGIAMYQSQHDPAALRAAAGSDDPEDINALIVQDSAGYDSWLADRGNLSPGTSINKNVYLQNTGTNAAYVRARVMVPMGLDDYVQVDFVDNTEFSAPQRSDDVWTVDGKDYVVYTAVRVEPLEAGEMSGNSMTKISLRSAVTGENLNDLLNAGVFDVNAGGDHIFSVSVWGDAIQALGFNTAEEAFAVFDAQLTNP